jgi:hypothetical protein
MHFDFTNVLNHMQPNHPALNIFSPGSWEVLGTVETCRATLRAGRTTIRAAAASARPHGLNRGIGSHVA